MTNILILSAGTRNKIVQYFKQALNGKGRVLATDMSGMAPAIYEANQFFVVPPMSDSGYIDHILQICKDQSIDGILSLIDPELNLLAENEVAFSSLSTTVIGSPLDACERSLDKYKMYEWLTEHGYNCAKTWLSTDEFYEDLEAGVARFPVFVKPIRGSASISISQIDDREMLDLVTKHETNLIIQEYLDGQEIGADVYIDMLSNEVVSIFTKRKLKMRAGETDKAVSFKDPDLFNLIERFALEAGYRGQIDIDIFDLDGEYYISEVNPRFGGGYPHAYECGCDHMSLIANNLCGIANKPDIGTYDEGIYMMKYNEMKIAKDIVK